MTKSHNSWWIYTGSGKQHRENKRRQLPVDRLPAPPSWRHYATTGQVERQPPLVTETRGATFQASDKVIELVNAALYLRRPLLITGKPGSGKSSLAYAVAYELNLGPVLLWPINSRSTLQEGQYRYDVIGRLYDADLEKRTVGANSQPDIGRYLRLGPLGTAMLPTRRPRVLLIDEIDKSDVDLPNDLLNIFEEGQFEIPELSRLPAGHAPVRIRPHDSVDDEDRVEIAGGRVRCHAFPFVVLTSNGEREFPPAFLRRCLRLHVELPTTAEALGRIVAAHFQGIPDVLKRVEELIAEFLQQQEKSTDSGVPGMGEGNLATDQLLNAVYFAVQGVDPLARETLKDALLGALSSEIST
jgi:MoxR-like ATPase